MSDNRYDRVNVRGYTLDRWTAVALKSAEGQLGYTLRIAQGSYNGGRVSQSAGTHDGGGAIDVVDPAGDWDAAVLALRQNGFAAWHRTPAQGPWGHHIHAVLVGNAMASPSAQRQVEAYRDGRNGLANNGPDDGPRVTIREFPYPKEFTVSPEDEAKIKAIVDAAIQPLLSWVKSARAQALAAHVQGLEANAKLDEHTDGDPA